MQKISVVIITKDRAQSVLRTIKRLRRSYPCIPLIVVDNASEDTTVSLLENTCKDVIVIPLEKNLGAEARNIGVREAHTPFVAFCDDDSYWEKGSLEKAVLLFEQYPTLGLINGKVIVHHKKIDPVCSAMEKSPLPDTHSLPGKPILGFVACGAIIRTGAFFDAGGFPKYFGVGGEEMLLAVDMAKKGWQLQYIETIVAYHNPSPVRNVMRRQEVQIRNRLWFTWLRRRFPSICKTTLTVLKASCTKRSARIGLEEAIQGITWVIKNREPVPKSIEERLQLISYI